MGASHSPKRKGDLDVRVQSFDSNAGRRVGGVGGRGGELGGGETGRVPEVLKGQGLGFRV